MCYFDRSVHLFAFVRFHLGQSAALTSGFITILPVAIFKGFLMTWGKAHDIVISEKQDTKLHAVCIYIYKSEGKMLVGQNVSSYF